MIWHFVFDNVLRCSCVCVWVSINMLFCNFNICCGDNNKKLSLQRKKKIFFRCCSIASSLNIHISIQQHVCLNIRLWRNRCRLLRLPSKRTRKKSSQMDTNWIWISRCRRERHASAIFSSEVAIGWADWINVTLEHTMYVMKTKLIPAICEFIQTSWTFSTVFFIRDHDDVADKVRNYLLCCCETWEAWCSRKKAFWSLLTTNWYSYEACHGLSRGHSLAALVAGSGCDDFTFTFQQQQKNNHLNQEQFDPFKRLHTKKQISNNFLPIM